MTLPDTSGASHAQQQVQVRSGHLTALTQKGTATAVAHAEDFDVLSI